jgi:hypothetical protein
MFVLIWLEMIQHLFCYVVCYYEFLLHSELDQISHLQTLGL